LTYPRGTAFHEAGHAIVGWSFGLEVRAVRVSADDASGGADIAPHGHLSLAEQLAIYLAGIEAENLFQAPAHRWVFGSDFDAIQKLLAAHEITNGQGPALRECGRAIARKRLKMYRAKVVALAERLMECGSVEASEFGSFVGGRTA